MEFLSQYLRIICDICEGLDLESDSFFNSHN
ncbi:hypothetical protein OIU79_007173 [Salix purpurea]|uniref:Uncharacterized protein n=1 Tax=Salix purpurea TaxID=77065 RepID=A0A9Q0Z2W3_SALPP|nr:hypothetical protein OIU79_007173 [Salix purpurea]